MTSADPIAPTGRRAGRAAHLIAAGAWLLVALPFEVGASAAGAPTAGSPGESAPAIGAAAAAPVRRKWASSLPTSAPQRHSVTSLSYEALSQHIGDRVLITTIYGDLRDVKIESYSIQELLVRVGVVGGYATQHIMRSQIRSIRDPG